MKRKDAEIPLKGFYEDAPASVLTPSQRRYLLGETEKDTAQARAIDSRIRSRIVAAFHDLNIVWRVVPEEEIQKMRRDEYDDPPLQREALAAWLYRLQPNNPINATPTETSPEDRDRATGKVERDISVGVQQVIEHYEGVDVSVETAVSIERSESLEELAEGDLTELSREQLLTLLQERVISDEEYGEAVREKISAESV